MIGKKNLKPLVILGAGGHAVSVANVAMDAGFSIAYFIDKKNKNSSLLGIEVIQDISVLKNILDFEYAIAIGDNTLRELVYHELQSLNTCIKFPALIHNSAVVSSFSNIDNGSVIMPRAVIGPNVTVGKFCILNTLASIDHDSAMSDFSSLAPHAVTGGNVRIGQRSAISINATVKHGLIVGDDCVLGAHSYLNKDLLSNSIAYGIPAKLIRSRLRGENYLS